MRRATLVACWALAAIACGRSGSQGPVPTAATADPGAEVQAIDQALDAVEERLLVGQSRVRFWSEMRDRHESVTAIATVNLERHAESIARFDRKAPDHAEPAASAKRSRVAARLVRTAQATR